MKECSKLNALIIAPEITKGMKSIGSKSLLKVKYNKCILDYQIQALKNIDQNINITVITGFESEKVELLLKEYKGIRYIYNTEYKTTNQSSSLRLYLENNPTLDNLFVLSSGILIKNNCINRSMLNKNSKIFLLNKNKENFTLGCGSSNTLEYLFYNLPEAWSECIYLNTESISWLQKFIKCANVDQMYIFEVINEILSHKIKIEKTFINKKDIFKIVNQKDIKKAKVFV